MENYLWEFWCPFILSAKQLFPGVVPGVSLVIYTINRDSYHLIFHRYFPGQNIAEIAEHQQKRREKYSTYGINFQPSIYALKDDERYFIKFDDVSWEFKSLVKTLDICFKTYQVLNLQYQFECSQMWMLIQRYFYDIETVYDSSSPALQILLHDLQQFQ